MKRLEESGSVRVDLLGGTIDLNPICLILPDVVTLNIATELKAKALIEEVNLDGIEIVSSDYNTTEFFSQSDITPEHLANDFFGPLKFVMQIVHYFNMTKGLRISLESGSPAGAGLGGSSAMGVTLYKALARWTKQEIDPIKAISIVNAIEARILDCGPAGYQDYYPALFGGVLGLVAKPGNVEVNQLYSKELAEVLEKSLTLVYSGQTRLSGINNWEVYKGFFDKNQTVREGLKNIALLSNQAFLAIKEKKFSTLPEFIAKEGEIRTTLFPGIVSPDMERLYNKIRADVPNLGMKVCGAGGGGCFLLVHSEQDSSLVRERVVAHTGMSVLDLKVAQPL